jgi:uncharacterized protein
MDTPPPTGKKWLCQRCGNCCRWPGLVRVTDNETDIIAQHLNIPVQEFIEKFTKVTPDRRGLTIISKEDESCFFFEEPNNCKINDVKPSQCSGFPNTWNFPGWEEKCEAILIDSDSFDQAVEDRDN